MSFPSTFLDELRTRLSITDVVGRRVTWDRGKSNPRRKDYWACCPFHGEKTPSFHVDENKGFYHCFGCGAHGDIISFVKDMDNLSFLEAVERLAADAGMQMPERTPEMRAEAEARAGILDVLEMATLFFERALSQSSGEAARAYLDGRNLSPKAWERFRLGYAPGQGSVLSDYLINNNIKPAQIVEAGLAFENDRGGLRDRFRDRIMFPILNAQSKVIAFGGRAMDPGVAAKYYNSPETPVFHKGRTLYNLAGARTAAAAHARADNTFKLPGLVVAEGYMDVIALALVGINQSVAPLGTAMTEEQIFLAWKMCPEPVLCFDGDEAGMKAASRAMDLALPLLKAGHSLSFAILPTGYDPDDLIRERGVEAIHAVLQNAVPLIEFLWQREIGYGPFDTPEKRAALEERLDASIRDIKDEKVRRFYQQAIRDRLRQHFNAPRVSTSQGQPGYGQQSRQSYGQPYGKPQAGRSPQQGISAALRRSPLAQSARLSGGLAGAKDIDAFAERERVLVATVLRFPELLEQHSERFADIPLERPELDKLRHEILDGAASGMTLNREGLQAQLTRKGASHLADQLIRHTAHKHPHLLDVDADYRTAEQKWTHTLVLHCEVLALRREAKEAEVLFQQDSSDENWRRLRRVQTQLMQATALQDGDG